MGGEADFGEPEEDESENRLGVVGALRPLFAQKWSAASRRRFSSVPVAESFPDGAIKCIQFSLSRSQRGQFGR